MTLFDLLDRPIAFHAPLVDLTGSINAALMLSQAIYWSKRTKHDGGWFYKSREEWHDETKMTEKEIRNARKRLKETGFWEERHDRVSHRVWFRVNQDALVRALIGKNRAVAQRASGSCPKGSSSNRAENTYKEGKGASLRSSTCSSFQPQIKYPATEDEMAEILRAKGVEYNPDYDGQFFDTMTRNDWKIRGTPIVNWVAVYQARLLITSPEHW